MNHYVCKKLHIFRENIFEDNYINYIYSDNYINYIHIYIQRQIHFNMFADNNIIHIFIQRQINLQTNI